MKKTLFHPKIKSYTMHVFYYKCIVMLKIVSSAKWKKIYVQKMPMHCMHRSAADPETFQTGAGPCRVVWGDKQKGVGEFEHFGNISCLFTI